MTPINNRKRRVHMAALIATLAWLVACSDSYTSSITPAALHAMLQAGQKPIIIDVRSETEFAEGRIPGAMNIPHNQIDAVASDINDDRDEALYLYDENGRRSGMVADRLREEGYRNVVHIEGDMPAWIEAGLPVET